MFQSDFRDTGVDWYDTGKRNDEEGAKEKLFTYASYVIVDSFKVRELTWSLDVLTA